MIFGRLMGRRERPPAEATEQLDPEERVLSWGHTDSGPAVLATQRGLWLPGEGGYRRIGWHEITKLSWADGTLTVIEGKPVDDGDFVEDVSPATWSLAEHRDLPKVMRARVEHSVEVSEHHELRPIGGVRIVGRRISGQDGLSWVARCDPGTDRESPAVQAQVTDLLADARVRFAPPSDI